MCFRRECQTIRLVGADCRTEAEWNYFTAVPISGFLPRFTDAKSRRRARSPAGRHHRRVAENVARAACMVNHPPMGRRFVSVNHGHRCLVAPMPIRAEVMPVGHRQSPRRFSGSQFDRKSSVANIASWISTSGVSAIS
jgi:hypothetical protein